MTITPAHLKSVRKEAFEQAFGLVRMAMNITMDGPDGRGPLRPGIAHSLAVIDAAIASPDTSDAIDKMMRSAA